MDLDDLELKSMNGEELRDLLARLDELYNRRQALEPDDEESDDYDEWEESLEEIDDLIDDIRDRLEELEI